MKTTYSMIMCAALAVLGFSPALSAETVKASREATAKNEAASVSDKSPGKGEEKTPSIQLAILLDTSSSMSGLINQARTYLWQIVNEMTLARQNGKLPRIRIALYEYGNSRLSDKEDYIRQVIALTDDLDAVSEALFKLETCGGDEYCGSVIRRAVRDLAWEEKDRDALKLIFVAGNEPFDQGNVPYPEAISEALAKGITVNTVLCGKFDGDQLSWKDGAVKGDGSFVMIDQDRQEAVPETPQDKALTGLNLRLNKTYLAYGDSEAKQEKVMRQTIQDEQSATLGSTGFFGRAKAKANKDAYKNSSWDLVDAFKERKELSLEEMKSNGLLPKELEGKSVEEMKALIETTTKEREAIQAEMLKLSDAREAWLKAWRKSQAASGKEKGLNEAIIETVRQQASKKNFSFPSQASKK